MDDYRDMERAYKAEETESLSNIGNNGVTVFFMVSTPSEYIFNILGHLNELHEITSFGDPSWFTINNVLAEQAQWAPHQKLWTTLIEKAI
jgi:hypothetical protein